MLDGATVAAARVMYIGEASLMVGGATLPHARSRGAYRALIAARYEDAVERVGRGEVAAATLVVQAGAMSRPILERLGFETVCVVQVLVDERA